MATNNRGGKRAGNGRRSGRNNNPEGRNQYSRSPLATAATVGGAVAAGIFLWSRRNQISEQIGNLAEQVGEWRDGFASNRTSFDDSDSSESFTEASGSASAGGQRSQADIAAEALTLKEIGEAS